MPVPYGGEILLNLHGLRFKNFGSRIVVITPTFSLLVRAGPVSNRLVLVPRRRFQVGCDCSGCLPVRTAISEFFNMNTNMFGSFSGMGIARPYATTKRYSVITFDTPGAERFSVREAPEIAHSNMPTSNPVNAGNRDNSVWWRPNSTQPSLEAGRTRETIVRMQTQANLRPEPSASEVAAINGLSWQVASPGPLSEAYARTYTRPRSVANLRDSVDSDGVLAGYREATNASEGGRRRGGSEREGGL